MCSRRASAAVNNLKRFHEKKKKGLKPHSLYLDHIIRKSVSSHNRRDSRVHKDIYVIKVNPNIVCSNLREFICSCAFHTIGLSFIFFVFIAAICGVFGLIWKREAVIYCKLRAGLIGTI